jgi:hypothetical protein
MSDKLRTDCQLTPSCRLNLQGINIRGTTPHVIAKTGRHKAQRVILTENAEAIIERKLGWMPEQRVLGPEG